MRILVAILVSMLSTYGYCAEVKNVTGKITKVQLMGKNYQHYTTSGEAIAFVYVDSLPEACGAAGGYKRVAITSNHPAFNIVVSGALAAKAKGDLVQVFYIDQCTQWNGNAWDFAILTVL